MKAKLDKTSRSSSVTGFSLDGWMGDRGVRFVLAGKMICGDAAIDESAARESRQSQAMQRIRGGSAKGARAVELECSMR
jgi:hypothetical protein